MSYEYTVEVVYDKGGAANLQRINDILYDKGRSGWRLIAVSTNELGKNAVSVAGFGVNATVDQTLLFFEREKEIHELQEKPVELLVDKSNIVNPILPYKVRFLVGSNKLQLVVTNELIGNITGIQARIIIYNIFGEKYEGEYSYFLNFSKDDRGFFYSDYIKHDINDGFISGGLKCDFMCKKYVIGSNDPIDIEKQELTSIKTAIENDYKKNEYSGVLEYEDFVKAYKDTRLALDSFMMYQNGSTDQKKAIEIDILSKL